MLSEEQIQILEKYNMDKNKIMKTGNMIYPYAYVDLDGLLILDLIGIDDSYFNFMNIEELIQKRTDKIKECIENEDYETILFLLDKPYRLQTYENIFYLIPDDKKYDIFISVYVSAEYGFNDISEDFLDEILEYRPNKEFPELDEELIICRGEGKESTNKEYALSWTTDIKIAEFFANRFGDNGVIYKGKVKKEDIIDFIQDRGESEVLVKYEYIYDVEKIN